MNSLLPLIFLIYLMIPGYLQDTSEESLFQQYKVLNDSETRLLEFKDSDEHLRIKLIQLGVINQSRKKYGVEPVKLDILASRLANMQSREAANYDYVGHWNLKGEKPYHRYSLAGGVDHVTENAAGEMTTGRFPQTVEYIARLMRSSHEAFMAERRPNDGHKQTVIDKNHNWVGIGFFHSEQQFRYYEEYIDRYYLFGDIPSSLQVGESFNLRVNAGSGRYLLLLLAYREDEPSGLSIRQIRFKGSYNDYSNDIGLQVAPWELADHRRGDWYEIPVSFNKPGWYYIHLYSDNKPYRNGSTFNSKGKLQASGIVVRVEK